jgi:hypothetical protein
MPGQALRRIDPPERFLLEHALNAVDDRTATYLGVRTTLEVRPYADGFQELYDLWDDPYELHNAVHRMEMGHLLRDLMGWALDECRPPPRAGVAP